MSELYQLPDGWEWKKLDDITELITKGTTPTTNGYKFQNSGINFLKIENIVNGEIDLSTIEMFISEEAHQSQKRSQLQENDVLFSIAGTIGDTAIVKKEHLPMNTNQAIALIRPKQILNSFFLKYSLVSIISQNTKDKQRGGAIKNISLGDIKNLMYPLPPLEKQKRIVSKLDSLFEKIDKSISLHQKNIDEANVFMASVLNDVFVELEEKYLTKTIDEVSLNVQYGYTDSAKDKGNAVFIRITDINENGKFKDNFVYVDIEDKELNKFKLYKGDILVARSGATAGKVALYNLNFVSVFASYLIRIQPNSEMNSSFFFYFCHSPKYWEQLNTIKVGGAQPNVNATNLKEIKIATPLLPIQQKVVAYLDEISQKLEKIKQLQKEKMQSLKALKASILDKAFRGEL
jgi:restriction endonuclease S subunit